MTSSDTSKQPRSNDTAPLRSPITMLGGKFRLAKQIVERFPEHHTYVEPFLGAGWVFFAKNPATVEVLNDINGELVTFWRVVQHHLDEFLRYFRYAVVSRELFELIRDQNPRLLTEIQRAVRFFYVQRLAYGGRPDRPTFGSSVVRARGLNLDTLESHLNEIHRRLRRVTIERLDAQEIIRRYDSPGTLFFIDPPYYGTKGYSFLYTDEDFVSLAETLRSIRGRFLLTLNDVPRVRELFDGFEIEEVTTRYTVGNPRTSKSTRGAERKELFIHNLGRP